MIIYWKRLKEDLIVLYYIDCMMFYMLLYYCNCTLFCIDVFCSWKKKQKTKKIKIYRFFFWHLIVVGSCRATVKTSA